MPSSVSASPAITHARVSSPHPRCSSAKPTPSRFPGPPATPHPGVPTPPPQARSASPPPAEKPCPDEPVDVSANGDVDSTCPLGPPHRRKRNRFSDPP